MRKYWEGSSREIWMNWNYLVMFFLKLGFMLCGFFGVFIFCNFWFVGFFGFVIFWFRKSLGLMLMGLFVYFVVIFVCLVYVEGKEL